MGAAFVGRHKELAVLDGHLAAMLGGQTRFCFVAGEAGAGKSTLIQAFAERSQERHPELVVVVGACNAQTGRSDPYLPFLGVLTQLTGDVQAHTSQASSTGENLLRLQALARVSVKALVDVAPQLIGTLVPGSSLLFNAAKSLAEHGILDKLKARLDETGKAGAPGEVNQDRICQQYTDLLTQLSKQCPIVLVVDDMQWIDSASVDLFFHLSRKLEHSRVLVVGCYRPNDVSLGRSGDRHPLEPVLNEVKRYFGDVGLDLASSSKEDRRSFVDAYLDSEPNRLGEDFREGLCRHTSGHPLFVVELLRNLQERGDLVKDSEDRWTVVPCLDWRVLPSRVEGVIEERVGRLETELREILTIASVEGESFTAQVIARVHQVKERELLRLLTAQLEKRHRLVQEGSTEKIGANWVSRFAFAHVLVQQYLYRDLGGRERMLLHQEIAELIEEMHAGQTESVALQLARHYDAAEMPEKAIGYQVQAARRALGLSAYIESRALLERALEILPGLPAGADRDRLELQVRNLRSTILNAKEGWDSPVLIEEYYRIRSLCQALGERRELSRLLFGLWTYHMVRLDLMQAYAIVQEYFELAREMADRETLLMAHTGLSNTLFWMGRVAESLEHGREALALFDPETRDDHVVRYGQDPRLIPLMLVGYCHAVLGEIDAAREVEREALRLAQELDHPFSQTIALQIAGDVAYNLRDAEAARAYSEEEARLARVHQFPFYLGLARTRRGWADALLGQPLEGAAEVREGFATWAGFGGKLTHSVYCLMLAEAEALVGRSEEALAVLERGLQVALESGELCYVPELYRVKGELLADRDPAAAEALVLRAVEAARSQGARLFESRAAASLARLDRTPSKETVP